MARALIVALLLIAGGLPGGGGPSPASLVATAGAHLGGSAWPTLQRARGQSAAADVVVAPLVSNLRTDGFAVAYTTDGEATGALLYGLQPTALITTGYDDRDGAGPVVTRSTVHRVTLTGLQPGQAYYYEPEVDGTPQPGPDGEPYSQTLPLISTLPVGGPVARGSVGDPTGVAVAAGAGLLRGVWVNPDGGVSAPLTALTTAAFEGRNYTLYDILMAADGAAYFTPVAGAVLSVTAWADVRGALTSASVVTASVSNGGSFTELPPLTTAPAQPVTLTMTLTVQAGWNLLTLPLQPPAGVAHAQDLLGTLTAASGGSTAEIATWAGSSWLTALSAPGAAPADLTLTLGQGFFLYSDAPAALTVTGTLPSGPPELNLGSGWNLIGLPTTRPAAGQTATDLLHSLAAAGLAPVEVATWLGGGWQVTLTGSDPHSPGAALSPTSGYFVYLSSGGHWSAGAFVGQGRQQALAALSAQRRQLLSTPPCRQDPCVWYHGATEVLYWGDVCGARRAVRRLVARREPRLGKRGR